MYSVIATARCDESRPWMRYQARFFSMSPRPNRSRSQVSTRFVPGSVMPSSASVNASHCSSSPCAFAVSMSSFWFALKSAAASASGRRWRVLELAGELGDHGLHPVGEQLALRVGVAHVADRAGSLEPKSFTFCTNWRSPLRLTAASPTWPTTYRARAPASAFANLRL